MWKLWHVYRSFVYYVKVRKTIAENMAHSREIENVTLLAHSTNIITDEEYVFLHDF